MFSPYLGLCRLGWGSCDDGIVNGIGYTKWCKGYNMREPVFKTTAKTKETNPQSSFQALNNCKDHSRTPSLAIAIHPHQEMTTYSHPQAFSQEFNFS